MWTFYEIFGNLKIKNQEEGIINKKRKKMDRPIQLLAPQLYAIG